MNQMNRRIISFWFVFFHSVLFSLTLHCFQRGGCGDGDGGHRAVDNNILLNSINCDFYPKCIPSRVQQSEGRAFSSEPHQNELKFQFGKIE